MRIRMLGNIISAKASFRRDKACTSSVTASHAHRAAYGLSDLVLCHSGSACGDRVILTTSQRAIEHFGGQRLLQRKAVA